MNQKKNSTNKYKFLNHKSTVIHNIIDEDKIIKLSNQNISDFNYNKPIILMLGNVRPEKNHILGLYVFKKLKGKGFSGTWINIGSASDLDLVNNIKQKTRKLELEDGFLFIGSRDNPYPYIKKSDLIINLSKFESWSMVISEALILNKKVLSTKTSGAIEQIIDGENGYLVDFDIESIHRKIYYALQEDSLKIQFNFKNDFEKEFSEIINFKTEKNEIAYIIDDINYRGGAHFATFNQIRALYKENIFITVITYTMPSIKIRNILYKSKIITINDYSQKKLKNLLEGFKTVIVMSEASRYRKVISELLQPKKIQYIHTDYKLWSEYNNYNIKLAKNDYILYMKYDRLIFVSNKSRKGFIEKYPALECKTTVIRNIIDTKNIIEKSQLKEKSNLDDIANKKKLKLVTISRLESEKGLYEVIDLAKELKEKKIEFIWNIIGDGHLREDIERNLIKYDLTDRVFLLGHLENPYNILKNSDVFILLSKYEGLPNTAYESLVLGVPIIANDVGGISEQVINGYNGLLLNYNHNHSEKINEVTKFLLNDIKYYKYNLTNYSIDNKNNINSFIDELRK